MSEGLSCGRLLADQAGDTEHPQRCQSHGVGYRVGCAVSLPKRARRQSPARPAGPQAQSSALHPTLSRRSSCWSLRQRVFADPAAPHVAAGPGWPAARLARMGCRRPADSLEPKLPPAHRAVPCSTVRHREFQSPKDARSARTPGRPPTLPCSHRRRDRRGQNLKQLGKAFEVGRQE